MPSSAPRPALLHLAAYLLFLCSAAIVWYLDSPNVTFDTRDARLALWLSRLHFEWGGPFDLTLLNPYQGMVGMAIPLNPYWTPPMLPAVLLGDSDISRMLVMVVDSLEIALSSYLLLAVLGFRPLLALCAVLFLHFLLFPPFTFAFGFHGWLQTGPYYGHTIALANLLLVSFVLLGRIGTWSGSRRRRAGLWAALVLGAFLLLAGNLVSVPFYAAGVLVGYAGLGAAVVAATPGLAGRVSQLLAAAALLAILLALETASFFSVSRQLSARFVEIGDASILAPLLQPDAWSLGWEPLAGWFCAHGIACSIEGFPVVPRTAILGSVWIQLAGLAGAGLAALRWSGFARRFAACYLGYALLLLLFWTLMSQGMLGAFELSPLYLYFALYPFWAAFSLYAVGVPAAALGGAVAGAWRRRRGTVRRFRGGALPASLGHLAPGLAAALLALHFALALEPGRVDPPPASRIVAELQARTALAPGDRFRGSTATVLGPPGSFLRDALGPPPGAAVPPGQFEVYLQELAARTGSSHALLDLWHFDIPTLEEYGQAYSRPMAVYGRALSSDAYVERLHFLTADLPVVPLLEAVGVRYVISDADLSGAARELAALPIGAQGRLRLYELPAPNLGDYSPTRIRSGLTAPQIMAAVRRDPARLRERAFADGIAGGGFVPAQEAEMRVERGGIRVRAASDGRTALLLPVQFSHCLELEPAGTGASLHRANVAQSLLLFHRRADLLLRWRFGPLGEAQCRAEDLAELRRIGAL